jgi:DNA repair ATPase RecN
MEKITAIGTVSLDSKTAIEEARATYNALTVTQRSLVTNYETLTAAEDSLKVLQDAADKAAADKAAADAVTEKIAAIGTVTKDSKAAIEAARAAYDALTAEQKTLVTNYETLTAAEQALAELSKPSNPPTGDYTVLLPFAILAIMSAACLVVLPCKKNKFVK